MTYMVTPLYMSRGGKVYINKSYVSILTLKQRVLLMYTLKYITAAKLVFENQYKLTII